MKFREHNKITKTNSLNQLGSLKKVNIVHRKNIQKSKSLESKQNMLLMHKTNIMNIQQKQNRQRKQNISKNLKAKQTSQTYQYEKQIMVYIKSRQKLFDISSSYIKSHSYLTHKLRSTFIKHFFKVGQKFKLKRQTVYLAVYYMDAFFSKSPQIDKKQSIVSAQACLHIAMKYNQIYMPSLHQWTQPIPQLILAEAIILKKLDFNLEYTSIEKYFQFFFSKVHIKDHDKQMIRLIADVSLFDETMYELRPSELSISMIYSIVNRSKLEQKMQMKLKWMMERNQKYMQWLQTMNINKKNYGYND